MNFSAMMLWRYVCLLFCLMALVRCFGGATPAFAQPGLPTLTSLTPNTAPTGSQGVSITCTGTLFTSITRVRWNGANRPTRFISTTQVKATLSADDLRAPTTAQITVDVPDYGTTNPLPFIVTQNAPMLTSLNPSSATAGGKT
jgi:hypothetical protein